MYGNSVARYKIKIIVLPLLLTISSFSLPNRYSFDTDAILKSNFRVGISVVCVVGLFYLLKYFYYSSTNNRKIYRQFADEKPKELSQVVEQKKGTVHYVKVPRQNGADCGFHAVKNVKLLVENIFTNIPDLETIIKDAGFEELEEWRQYTQEHFQARNSLEIEAVEGIALEKAYITPYQFSIIQNLPDFNPAFMGDRGFHLADGLDGLNKVNGTRHGFLAGSMRGSTGSYGHWVGILAERKNDQIHYYIADSLNQDNKFWAEQLDKILGDKEITTKLRWSGSFENILDTIESRLNNIKVKTKEKEKVVSNLESLTKILHMVTDNNLFDENYLKKIYFGSVSKYITATMERAQGLEDNKIIIKKLGELQEKFCEPEIDSAD